MREKHGTNIIGLKVDFLSFFSLVIIIIIIIIIIKWLDIPISGTLSNVFLVHNKFGLNICPPSVKFTQCQTVLRN